MQNKKLIILCILCLSALMSWAQASKELTSDVEVNTIEDSNYILYHQMGDSLYQAIEERHVNSSNRLIKTEKEALELGKQVFLKEFGKNYNLESRRYMVHHIKGYWIVKGLQPHGYTGGTLVAVFDSESGQLFCSLYWK